MSALVRVCRDCGEEYRAEATRCSDCGGELVDRQLDESGAFLEPEAGAENATGSPDVSSYRAVFVTPRAAELVPLAEALRGSDVPYHLAEQPAHTEGAAPRYALLVPEDAVPAALGALAPHLAPGQDAADVAGIESRFEPERGYLRCPACGAEQPPGATDCGECGLTLGAPAEEEQAVCARCGAPMPETGEPCGECGSARIG